MLLALMAALDRRRQRTMAVLRPAYRRTVARVRVVATLAALVERAGDVVTKGEILDRVWAGEDVGESNVAQSVYTLRKILREHGLSDAIATVPRRGYRFVAPVERLPQAPVARVPLRAPAVHHAARSSAWRWRARIRRAG